MKQQLAFYAPLKSPDHPVPSGDRKIAQNIMTALSMNTQGLKVALASQLRCYDGAGNQAAQKEIRIKADAEINRLLKADNNWCAWVTYHNYYKAPDLIGAAISQQLNIPYILIEASIAKSRLKGRWSDFAVSADSATEAADVVFYLTEKDRIALAEHRPDKQTLVHLAPFLGQADLAEVHRPQPPENHLITVGMHRYGDKLESYRIIAEMLPHLNITDWHLSIVGDGPARAEIESMFTGFEQQVSFMGQLDSTAVAAALQQASVFVWPGVNEAFGMVYLEAQAAGLPVIAQDRPGVREVIATPDSLVPVGEPESLARAIDDLLTGPVNYDSMVQAGRQFVRERHLLGAAADTLSEQLLQLLD